MQGEMNRLLFKVDFPIFAISEGLSFRQRIFFQEIPNDLKKSLNLKLWNTLKLLIYIENRKAFLNCSLICCLLIVLGLFTAGHSKYPKIRKYENNKIFQIDFQVRSSTNVKANYRTVKLKHIYEVNGEPTVRPLYEPVNNLDSINGRQESPQGLTPKFKRIEGKLPFNLIGAMSRSGIWNQSAQTVRA